MSAALKLFLSGIAGAAVTYAAGHLSGFVTNPLILAVVGGLLTSIGHALPSPVAASPGLVTSGLK
jgi:hypothetical protein